jgi:AcrR family transcriptional regulator
MDTRDRVLQAALDCFEELGYDRSSIARIRERSGVSNGALFHHFSNKEAIVDALYVEAMRSVQRGYWDVLESEPNTLRDGLDGIVRHMLDWIEANPRWARFLYAQGHLDWSSAAGSALRTLNKDLATAYSQWLGPFVAAEAANELPMAVVVAIVTGPAHAIAQRWLSGQLRGPLGSYADALVDAAVAGLSGVPTSRRRRATLPHLEGRIHIQLVGDDGVVVAEGQGAADFTPAPAVQRSRGRRRNV